MVTQWKKKAFTNMSEVFEKDDANKKKDFEKPKDNFYKKISKMKTENDCLRSKLRISTLSYR